MNFYLPQVYCEVFSASNEDQTLGPKGGLSTGEFRVERESVSVLHFPARRGLAECVGRVSCLSFCIPKVLLCLPLFMVLFHRMQEPLPNILTSFSGYRSQDVTVMLVESVGGDRLGRWARAEHSTKSVSHHRTSSSLDCCSLFGRTASTVAHALSRAAWVPEVRVAFFSHPPLGLVFAESPACSWDEDRAKPSSDFLLLSTRINVPFVLTWSSQSSTTFCGRLFPLHAALLSIPEVTSSLLGPSGYCLLPQWSLPAGLDQSPVLYFCFPRLFSFGALCYRSGYHLLYLIKVYLFY